MELEKIELPTKKKKKEIEEDNNLLFPNVMTDKLEEELLKNLSFMATADCNIFTLDCSSAGKDNILNFLSITEHLDRNALKDGVGYDVVIFTVKWSVVYNGVDKDFILTRIIDIMKEFNVPSAFIEDLKNMI